MSASSSPGRRVGALLEVDELSARVEERRRGIAANAELVPHLLVGVGDAWIGQGELLEEGLGGGVGVQCIYAEERDLVTAVAPRRAESPGTPSGTGRTTTPRR